MLEVPLQVIQEKEDRIIPALKARDPQPEDELNPPVPIGEVERIKRYINKKLGHEVFLHEHNAAGKTVVEDKNIVS